MNFCPVRLKYNFLLFIFALLFVVSTVYPQDYPKKIRGYKVFQTNVSVRTETGSKSEKKDSAAVVKIGEPEFSEVSLTGITIELPAEVEGLSHQGKIDFLVFEDFKVNGLDVEIEEYRESFAIREGERIALPKPVKLYLNAGQALRGAFKELKDSKDNWTVSGKLFVFGRFKKFGFNFKRVVPLNINISIENPVKKKLAQNDASK